MFCESYRKALTEAAIRGEALSPAGEAHLAGCAPCRAAFANERALAALVDGGLRSVANPETPASLVPRVRARIAEAPAAPAPGFRPFGLAAAALAMAGVAMWLSEAPGNKPTPGTSVLPAAQNSAPSPMAPTTVAQDEKPAAQRKTVMRRVAPQNDEPLVVVAPEERAGLEQYLAALSSRRQKLSPEGVALLTDVNRIDPLEITAIELKAMNTEPLDRGGAE